MMTIKTVNVVYVVIVNHIPLTTEVFTRSVVT